MHITQLDKNSIWEIDGAKAITASKLAFENLTHPFVGALCKSPCV